MTTEVKQALDSLEQRIEAKLNATSAKVDAGETESRKDREELKSMLDDHKTLVESVEGLKTDMDNLIQKNHKLEEKAKSEDSLGKQFADSPEFKSFLSGERQKARVELKTAIVNSGNDTSRHDQLDGVFGAAFRRMTVMPTIEQYMTDSNILYYSRETSWTNNAAGTAENTAKPESEDLFSEVAMPIRTVAHFIPVSKQSLDDSNWLMSFLDRRMSHGVNVKLENQIINGDGTGQNFSGWAAAGNSTATDPLLTGNIYGLANKMKYEIIAADYEPAYFYFNPQDWAKVETTQRGTGDAAYVGASGAINYVNNGLTALLWGLPVVISNAVPVGTMYCKARDADGYASRMGTVIEMFEQDVDNVQKNMVTVRAEARGAALNFAPAAIRSGDITAIT